MFIEERIITAKDKKWFYTYLDTEGEVDEVCDYLIDNNLTIIVNDEYYDHGNSIELVSTHVFLEDRQLSSFGGCFEGKHLLDHVRNFKKYEAIKNSQEYKKFLELEKKYLDVKKFYDL